MVKAGTAEYVLVIGVERLSDLTDIHDRGTAFIFGDGAGAVVIGPSDTPGIGPVVWGSEGDKYGTITQTFPWNEAAGAPTRTAARFAARSCRWRARRSSAGPPTRWPRSR